MDRKKAIRTTEATDRSLIPAVHSALVVGTQGHAFIEKCKKAEKEKNKIVHFRGKEVEYKGVIGCYFNMKSTV